MFPLFKRRLAVATALFIAWHAQAEPLTFDEALRLAEEQAPSLAAQAANLEAAQSSAIPAGELPDPKLLLGVQNYPIGGPDRWKIDEDFMTMQMVGVMQEVPNRAKRDARVERAQAGIERAEAERRVEALNVRLATAQAWISTHALERKLTLFKTLFEENRLFGDAIHAQLAGGKGQPAESLLPKQEAALLAEREDELQQLRAQARAALKRWLGAAGEAPLAGSLPNWPVNAQSYAHRLQHHPVLAAYAPMAEEAEAAVREAKAEKKSDWSWEVDYQRRGREFGDMVSLQVSVDLPLFPNSRQNPKIAAKYAELNRLEAERDAREREHAEELAAELADYQRLQRAVRRGQDSLLPLSEERVRLSLASYRAGQGALTDVIAARRELIETRLKQIDLEGQRALSNARLHLAYGENAR